MSPIFVGLEIGETIVHGVPQAGVQERDVAALELSDAASDLPEDVRAILQVKLREVLAHDARQIMQDSNALSQVPALARDLLDDVMTDLVSTSHKLAIALQASQTGRSPAGVLLIARASYEGAPAVLMVKLEREDGMRAQFITVDGKKRFDVEHLSDLLFTNRATVYKIGLLIRDPEGGSELLGWAADKQQPGKRISTFFLEKFLGCRYLEEPTELTRRFLEHGISWNNEEVDDPEKKARNAIALVSELQSQRNTISVRGFARSHLEPADRDSFVNYMRDKGVPSAPFEKSIDLVENRLKKVRLALESGSIVMAPLDVDDNVMSIRPANRDRVRITITDRLVTAGPDGSGGRPPKSTTPGGRGGNG